MGHTIKNCRPNRELISCRHKKVQGKNVLRGKPRLCNSPDLQVGENKEKNIWL